MIYSFNKSDRLIPFKKITIAQKQPVEIFIFELPPLNTLTSCLKWGIPPNTKVSLSFMSRRSP